MLRIRRPTIPTLGQTQFGWTLIETMIALAVGLMITAAMIGMMANTLGTGTRTIEMSRLQQELRIVMQFVSRDVRRASYNAEAIRCFGNLDCATDSTFPNGLPGEITLNSANDCFIFEMDRNHDGDPTNDGSGGFRLLQVNGSGRIQMWTGDSDTTCASTSSSWVDVTDPRLVDVLNFEACLEIDPDDDECNGLLVDGTADPDSPAQLSFSGRIDEDDSGNVIYLRTRKLQIRIEARLRDHPDIRKTLIDSIRIRNDIVI